MGVIPRKTVDSVAERADRLLRLLTQRPSSDAKSVILRGEAAHAAWELERLINPQCRPFVAPQRGLWGRPALVAQAVLELRDAFDEIYRKLGWQAVCEMTTGPLSVGKSPPKPSPLRTSWWPPRVGPATSRTALIFTSSSIARRANNAIVALRRATLEEYANLESTARQLAPKQAVAPVDPTMSRLAKGGIKLGRKQKKRGRKPIDPKFDAVVEKEWESGNYADRHDMANRSRMIQRLLKDRPNPQSVLRKSMARIRRRNSARRKS